MRKLVTEMFLHIIQIEVLHIPKSTRMKQYHQGNHLTTAHCGLSLGFISKDMFLNRFIKFLAEIVNKIENIGNFIIGKSHAIMGYVIDIQHLNIINKYDFSFKIHSN
jgi:hypothetical protein